MFTEKQTPQLAKHLYAYKMKKKFWCRIVILHLRVFLHQYQNKINTADLVKYDKVL